MPLLKTKQYSTVNKCLDLLVSWLCLMGDLNVVVLWVNIMISSFRRIGVRGAKRRRGNRGQRRGNRVMVCCCSSGVVGRRRR